MQKTGSNIIDLIKNEYFVQWIVSPTEESNHYWSKWIAAHPDTKQDIELARQLIDSAEYQIDEGLSTEDYNLILESIISYSQKRKSSGNRSTVLSWKLVGIAATVVLAFFLGILGVHYTKDPGGETVAHVETVTKTTLPGQKLTIRLPDGSKVMLNAESELSYTLPFVSNRSLTLTGEAFFEVTRDERHPFIIQSGNIKTKVLGTSFNIKSYPEEEESSVAVITGKVEVSDNHGNQAYLIPKVRGVFNLAKKQLLIEPFSVEHEIGWKDGLMIFENTPVREVLAQLERWYGVKINVKDKSLLAGDYTGSYKNASLEKVMNGISYTMGVEFSIRGKEVMVIKKKELQ